MATSSMSSDLSPEEEACREFSFIEVDEDFDGEIFGQGDEIKKENGFDGRAYHEILTTDEVVKEMLKCIDEVKSVTEAPVTTTRILLNHFRWEKEKMLENFYDGDQEALFKDAHIMNPYTTTMKQHINMSATEYCDICFTQHPSMSMIGLQCDHRFCEPCWVQYLTIKIMGEGNCLSISCAFNGCDIFVDDAFVMNVLTEPKVRTKYQQLITNSFVQSSRLLRWCPSPGCSYAIKVLYNFAQSVTCKCGHVFCFECGEQCHEPVKCFTLRMWNLLLMREWNIKYLDELKLLKDELATSKWIKAHSKSCPRCGALIEKNGGCNKMTCRRCYCQFCWICMEMWHDGGYYCNKVEARELVRDDEEIKMNQFVRLAHYYERYINHMQSLKLEQELYTSLKEKLKEIVKKKCKMTWRELTETEFLNEAVDILCRCRQTLMYSYAFAFYLVKTNQSQIFEDNQADLETATENLSGYLERDISHEKFDDIQEKVRDLYQYCNQRRIVLLDHVNEGYDNDWWENYEFDE